MKKVLFVLSVIVSSGIVCAGAASAVTLSARENGPAVSENNTANPVPGSQKDETSPVGGYEKYASQENYFSVAIPRDWERKEKNHPYGDLTKISGIRLTGPKNKDGASVTLSVLYYHGDGIFPTYGKFMITTLNSMVRTDYDRGNVITDTTIAGMEAKAFHIRTFALIYLPMGNQTPLLDGLVYEIVPPYIRVNMIQEYCVIPAKKGFYVLHYDAPEDVADDYRGVFATAKASLSASIGSVKGEK